MSLLLRFNEQVKTDLIKSCPSHSKMTSIILLPSDLRIHTSWQHTSPSGDGPHDENLRRTLYVLDDSNTNLVLCEQRRLNQNRNVRNVIQHSIGSRKSVDTSSVVVILFCQRDSKSRADCSDHILHEQVMSRADEFSLYRLAQCKFLTLRNESKNLRCNYTFHYWFLTMISPPFRAFISRNLIIIEVETNSTTIFLHTSVNIYDFWHKKEKSNSTQKTEKDP